MIKKTILTALCVAVFQFAHSQQKVQTNYETEENEQHDQEFKNTQWYKLMQKPHANYFSIRKKFDRYMERHPLGEGPKETGEEWFRKNIYYLDSKGRVQAPPAFNYVGLRAGIVPTSNVTDTMAGDWRMIGPRNQTLPGGGAGVKGGFSYCVRMDPTNLQKMFISFQTGGLWVSANGGIVWHLVDGNMPDNPYFDIVVCPVNTNIVYAISKSAVIKSTDGGYTWAVTGLNSTAYPSGQGVDVAVSPSDANIVVARWGNSLYRSTDGGTSWTSIVSSLNTINADGYVNNTGGILEWSNNDQNRVFFIDAAWDGTTAAIYASANKGASFTKLTTITIPTDIPSQYQNLKFIKIATATDNTSAVFAFLNCGYNYMQLYQTDVSNGATTLLRKNMVNNSGADAIAMDISNSSNIIYGTYGETNVHYSTDNGQTFATSNPMHFDIRSMHIVNGKVMVGNDGETVVSNDKGATFYNVSGGISNIELWGFGASFKSDILAAGCNHGPLTIRDYAGNGGWYTVFGADQQNTDVNPLDSIHVITRGYGTSLVSRTGIGTFTSAPTQVDPGREDWINNLTYHPYLFNTIVSHTAGDFPEDTPVATRQIWRKSLVRSDDNGLTLKVVYTFNDRLMSEKICMKDTNRIYCIVSPSNNHLWKTSNGGVNWAEITPSTSITGSGVTNISDVAVSDTNPDEIWVTYSGVQGTCKVLHSTDGGASYTNLTTSTLGTYPIFKIIFQRGTNGGVYVGNKSGVFYRNNSMADWQKLGTGLPMLEVHNLFINYYKGKLLIGTTRGAWDHDLYEHSSTKAQISASTKNPSCQSPTVQFRDYSVVSNGGTGATYSWKFPGGTPATSNSETPLVSYAGAPAGSYDVELTVTDQYGTNTHKLTSFITYDPAICCQSTAPGWTSEDIGGPAIAGSTCYNSGLNRFTVKASGTDIWDYSDQFRFNDTALNGNGQIVAKVVSLNGTSAWTKAGVMIRETTNTDSKHVYMAITPGFGANMQWRAVAGSNSSNVQGNPSTPTPYWVKLVRSGSQFTGYSSPDGVNWDSVSTINITMNAAVRIGIAVTNHDNTQLATAVVDNVNVSSSCITITKQPLSTTTCLGNNATFTTTVSGTGNTYQWLTNSGGGWYNEGDGNWPNGAVTGSTTTTLVKTVNGSTNNGQQWQLKVTNPTCGTILSNPATLTVTGAAITSQPVSATVCMGNNAVFSAATSGAGNTYQWQSYQGGSWINETDGPKSDGDVTGSTTPTLTKVVNTSTPNGRQWRLLVNNGTCSALTSNTVTLTVAGTAITTQPVSATVSIGGTATFNAIAAGTGNTYQWETNQGNSWYNEADGSWSDGAVSGATTQTLTKTVNAYTQNGRQWRLKVTNGACKVVSNIVVLTVASTARIANTQASAINVKEKISLYPNPTHNMLTITGMTGRKLIAVYNSIGVCIYSATITETMKTISTNNWTNGAYVIKITGTDGQIQNFEVIKN
ncbi:T9SS type A sorting domain-containing protein [Chitinophaga polysaccharea]|uniref:T9SS type A sorting domain-containing protein n=1 Tax=Chitinophaga polysaccharea TaxID=1293035 RepID=UPI0014556F75|nr:T9SS type A sorting domain-containing protein [Chitinophaga polysaccharea]NLR57408.1 T9SS type A sorting domain-containing protein [Chitinophaga polysaccharea]